MKLSEIHTDQTAVNKAYYDKWCRVSATSSAPFSFEKLARRVDVSGEVIDVAGRLQIQILAGCHEKAPFKFKTADTYAVSWTSLGVTNDYPLECGDLSIRTFNGDLQQILDHWDGMTITHRLVNISGAAKNLQAKNLVTFIQACIDKDYEFSFRCKEFNLSYFSDGSGRRFIVNRETELEDIFELQDWLVNHGFEAMV